MVQFRTDAAVLASAGSPHQQLAARGRDTIVFPRTSSGRIGNMWFWQLLAHILLIRYRPCQSVKNPRYCASHRSKAANNPAW
jgi:hypothetical protein